MSEANTRERERYQTESRREAPPAGDRPAKPGKKGCGTGCMVTVVVVCVVSLLAMAAFALMVFVGAGAGVMGLGQTEGEFRFHEVTLSGEPKSPKLVVVSVEGIITSSRDFGVDRVSLWTEKIKRARKDPSVKGMLLSIDSPGGGVTASDILYEKVRQFRSETGRPVVASLMNVAASGGYYVACAADKIVAHRTTITGSIGVMIPLYNASALLKKIGISTETVSSGPFKDIASPWVEKDEEQRKKERKILQSLIDEMYETFVEAVAEGRDMEVAKVRGLADGKIYTAEQALKHGLIDGIGYRDDALDVLKELAGIREAHVVKYERAVSLGEVVSLWLKGPRLEVGLAKELRPFLLARPMFLWVAPSCEEQAPAQGSQE